MTVTENDVILIKSYLVMMSVTVFLKTGFLFELIQMRANLIRLLNRAHLKLLFPGQI